MAQPSAKPGTVSVSCRAVSEGDVKASAWVLAEGSLQQHSHEMSLTAKMASVINMKCREIMLVHEVTDSEGRHQT